MAFPFLSACLPNLDSRPMFQGCISSTSTPRFYILTPCLFLQINTVNKPTSGLSPWTSCSEVLCPIVTLFLHRDGPSTATGSKNRHAYPIKGEPMKLPLFSLLLRKCIVAIDVLYIYTSVPIRLTALGWGRVS